MKRYQVKASAIVEAPAELVYHTLADYQHGHPSILPKRYFLSLEVEKGGFGSGTIINFRVRILGKTQSFRAAITELEQGRVLAETDLESGGVTTFSVDPLDGGKRTEVTIATEVANRHAGLGMIERFLTRLFLRRIYQKELQLLNEVCEVRSRGIN